MTSTTARATVTCTDGTITTDSHLFKSCTITYGVDVALLVMNVTLCKKTECKFDNKILMSAIPLCQEWGLADTEMIISGIMLQHIPVNELSAMRGVPMYNKPYKLFLAQLVEMHVWLTIDLCYHMTNPDVNVCCAHPTHKPTVMDIDGVGTCHSPEPACLSYCCRHRLTHEPTWLLAYRSNIKSQIAHIIAQVPADKVIHIWNDLLALM